MIHPNFSRQLGKTKLLAGAGPLLCSGLGYITKGIRVKA